MYSSFESLKCAMENLLHINMYKAIYTWNRYSSNRNAIFLFIEGKRELPNIYSPTKPSNNTINRLRALARMCPERRYSQRLLDFRTPNSTRAPTSTLPVQRWRVLRGCPVYQFVATRFTAVRLQSVLIKSGASGGQNKDSKVEKKKQI